MMTRGQGKESSCWCHFSTIMPDRIFHESMRQGITCSAGFVCLFFRICLLCASFFLQGDTSACCPQDERHGMSFITITSVGVGKRCVVFNQGCCVFVQYNLLKCCWEWVQPCSQVIDSSLAGFTWNTRSRIGIWHLSISGIVVHGRCYIFHYFYFSVIFCFCYFLWLFVAWSLFFVFAFMSPDSSLSNQESILTCLLSFWLIIKLYHYYYGSVTSCYSLYYIAKLHYSRLLYLNISWLFIWHCFLLYPFYFPFYSPISFTFTLQILLFCFVLHFLFYLLFVLLYLLSYYIVIYPA